MHSPPPPDLQIKISKSYSDQTFNEEVCKILINNDSLDFTIYKEIFEELEKNDAIIWGTHTHIKIGYFRLQNGEIITVQKKEVRSPVYNISTKYHQATRKQLEELLHYAHQFQRVDYYYDESKRFIIADVNGVVEKI